MKDFKLSDNKMTCGCCYHEKKVKESIRLLKEDLHQLSKTETLFHCGQCKQSVWEMIDKIFGEFE